MISAWGVDHGSEEFAKFWDEAKVKRAVDGKFSQNAGYRKAKTKWKSMDDNEQMATQAGAAAGAIGTYYLGAKLAPAAVAAHRLSNPVRAAAKAKAWEADKGVKFADRNDLWERAGGDARASAVKVAAEAAKLRGQAARGAKKIRPTEHAASRYAETHEGKQAFIDQVSGKKNPFTPVQNLQNKAFHSMLRNAGPNKTELYRGMQLSAKDAEAFFALKPGDKLPARVQSWSEDIKVAGHFAARDFTLGHDSKSVYLVMEKGQGRALNIQRRSGMAQSEWLSDTGFEVVRRDGPQIFVRAV